MRILYLKIICGTIHKSIARGANSMRAHINKLNVIAISQNMALYYLWHSFISANAVRLTNNLLDAAGASAASTQSIMKPLKIGINYMTVIGLAFRLTIAIAKTKHSNEGILHGVYTYMYNQEFIGILTNRQSLLCMISLGLLHNCFIDKQAIASNGLHEYLFKMLLPMLIGIHLDRFVQNLNLRALVTNKLEGLSLLKDVMIWGGICAPSAKKIDHKSIVNGIHAGL
jgi:hypothetical protein